MNDLEIVAELSVALAGFAGVVYTFGESENYSDIRAWRVRSLLIASLGTMLAALIPLGFGYLHIADSDMPRYASMVLTIVLMSQVTLIAPGFFHLSVSSRSKLGKRFFYSIFPLIVLMTLVQIANAAGAFDEISSGIFFYSLVMMLLVASAQFVISILDSSRNET